MHKMTRYAKNWGGMPPFGYAYDFNGALVAIVHVPELCWAFSLIFVGNDP